LKRARSYHWCLLLGSMVLALLYVFSDYSNLRQLLFLGSLPMVVQNARAVSSRPPARLDPYLGHLSITTLFFVVLFGTGQLLVS